MTTIYQFKAGYSKARIAAAPSAAPTIDIVDDSDNLLVNDGVCTASVSMPGLYIYEYTGADDLILVGLFHTSDATVDVQDIYSLAIVPVTGITVPPSTSSQYITLAELKANGALGITDTINDNELMYVIEATSRGIDNFCNQFFYQTAAQTRYFTPTYVDQCYITPMVSASAVTIDNDLDRSYSVTLVSGTDYDLYPYNAALESYPYWRIDRIRNSAYQFNKGEPKFVKVVGVWGWPAVPTEVHQACLMWAMRYWMRQKTILGQSAMTPLGQMTLQVPNTPDPDIAELLSQFHLEITGVI